LVLMRFSIIMNGILPCTVTLHVLNVEQMC